MKKNKKFSSDEEIHGINIELVVCFKKLPEHLNFHNYWLKEKPTNEYSVSIPENIDGKWIVAFFNLDFNSWYWQQESELVSLMRLVDYCHQLHEDNDDNLLFFQIKNKVSPFFNDSNKMRALFELDK